MNYIYLEVTGNPPNHRFLITNSEHQFYTGDKWSENRKEGKLYLDGIEAARLCLKLIKEDYKHCKLVYKYTVPLEIEVHATEPLDTDQFRKWLCRAVTTNVCYNVFGYGPVPNSLVIVETDWLKLTEAKNHESFPI